MSLVVGSARIDESGHISGGKPGDQTGNEVSTQAYYVHSKGWYCLRPKSITVAVVSGNPRRSTSYYPKYSGSSGSIITALAAVGEKDTSKAHRAKIAAANGITNYAYTAAQNLKMVNLLKNGKLIKA